MFLLELIARMKNRRVAVVTGSNSGIGFEIVRNLCQKFDGDVILCSLQEETGKAALQTLQKQGLNAKNIRLDITDPVSIRELKDLLMSHYGGLDILVNNAGIAHVVEDPELLLDIAQETMKVNYFGTAAVCENLFPILRPCARVVNMSSSAGMLRRIPGKEIQAKLSSPSLTREDIQNLIKDFYSAIRQGKRGEKGWPDSGFTSYTVSKVMVTALTWIQHKEFLEDIRRDIVINAVHPGYVITELSGWKGRITPEEGARTPVKCCLVPPRGQPRGQMVWEDGSVVDWYNDLIFGGASVQNSAAN